MARRPGAKGDAGADERGIKGETNKMKLPKVPQRTNPSFAFNILKRSTVENFGRRQFGQAEVEEVIVFFGDNRPECAFCGSIEVKRWDHVVPVMDGGETVIGNMVLACQECDDSKGKSPFEKWIWGDAPKSPKSRGIEDIAERVEKINNYVKHYKYHPVAIEKRLSKQEKQELARIEAQLEDSRRELHDLISSYRDRRGY